MSTSNVVVINITAAGSGVTQAGFGIPLILAVNAGVKTSFAERVRSYASLPAVGTDFATTSPEYKAATKIFSATPAPSLIMIGRRANLPTQQWKVEIANALNATVYKLRTGVTDTAVTSASTSASDIVNLLVAALNVAAPTPTVTAFPASPVGVTTYGYKIVAKGVGPFGTEVSAEGVTTTGKAVLDGSHYNTVAWTNVVGNTGYDIYRTTGAGGYTTGKVGSVAANVVTFLDTGLAAGAAFPGAAYVADVYTYAGDTEPSVRILAAVAGSWLPCHIYDPTRLLLSLVHADPSIADDLDAIQLENGAWYCALDPFASYAEGLALAEWIESNQKMCLIASADTRIITDAATGATDLAAAIKAHAYDRTGLIYCSTPEDFADADWAGEVLPTDPGSETWAFWPLAGVTAETLSDTQQGNCDDKKCSYLVSWHGVNSVMNGYVASGKFLDQMRSIDALSARIDESYVTLFTDKSKQKKVPFTDAGIAQCETVLRARLSDAVNGGMLTNDPKPEVTAPREKDVSTADKANRHLTLGFTAEGAGAIQGITINGSVST